MAISVRPDARRASGPMERLFSLKPSALIGQLFREPLAVWAILGYLFIEYVRPQSIITSLDVLPWAQLFLVLSMVTWVASPRLRWVHDPTHVWMLAFFGVIVLSTQFAIWPAESRAHWFDFVGWLVIYFLIVNIVTTESRLMFVLLLFVAASFKLSFYGARTWAARGFSFTSWGLMGPPGFFENSGELAVQMAVFTPIAYEMLVGLKPYTSRTAFRVLLFVPITGIMTILGASSRGSQLALAVQALKTFPLSLKRVRMLLALALVVTVGWFALPDAQKERFSTAGEDDTSRQRILYWEGGIAMMKQYPVLGVGFFNFAPYYQLHFSESLIMRQAQLPHNIFIQIGTDAGLLGLFVYVMLIYRAFRSTRDARRSARQLQRGAYYIALARGLDTGFIGFLVAGQFVTIGYYPYMWIHLAIVVAMRNILASAVKAQDKVIVPDRTTRASTAFAPATPLTRG